ncbi:MAG: hypothetical protein MZV64_33970 [Ignavibacteriales bacterium]|nr:hypothetical protein [Ignavibacteriales bacterium]
MVPAGTVLAFGRQAGRGQRQGARHRRDRLRHGRQEVRRGRLLRRIRAHAPVGPDRPRQVPGAAGHRRLALSQPGPGLPGRHRPGVRRQGLHQRRDDRLQQRPRQHRRPGRGQGQGVHRDVRRQALRSQGRQGPLRPALPAPATRPTT